jgi:hypothetical protein
MQAGWRDVERKENGSEVQRIWVGPPLLSLSLGVLVLLGTRALTI